LLNQGTLFLLNVINFFILLEMKCMKIQHEYLNHNLDNIDVIKLK